MPEEPTLESTIEFIKHAHAGQVDKGGTDYWRHPVSVMNRLRADASEECRMVALLHDVIEDTAYTAEYLRQMGYSAAVVNAVVRLTKTGDKPYLESSSRSQIPATRLRSQ